MLNPLQKDLLLRCKVVDYPFVKLEAFTLLKAGFLLLLLELLLMKIKKRFDMPGAISITEKINFPGAKLVEQLASSRHHAFAQSASVLLTRFRQNNKWALLPQEGVVDKLLCKVPAARISQDLVQVNEVDLLSGQYQLKVRIDLRTHLNPDR